MTDASQNRDERHDAHSASESERRLPHAVLDLPSRRLKGLKIERLLDLSSRRQPLRLLEVGTGSGGIAHYFGTHPDLKLCVEAVDVQDNRLVTEGYTYQQVTGTRLPFAESSFDVVLTNHVIEHVGDIRAQLAHLAELRRVLRADGIGYLAVPNRWMVVEPHYKLPFLSWLPRGWRTPYLRMMRRGNLYDCEPLELSQLEDLLHGSGFQYRNLCLEAMRLTFEIERPRSMATRVLHYVPDGALRFTCPAIPTLIYSFWR
ncbi:class I SAM-dependent methyltransferase [Dyella caseinilytica]|uniref:Class I SAM-dependent methyltransferase n=1 Tax=Dyella caseinilytica TaxID=1849581 RepID=A0ABX7GV98_9GAMM|nr:class I SAM-dependent methyltransferase [Dyella caseinilytica]QRN54394.1 class I SAM-dependent methyltransferase [Dyella caseinilytica]